MTIENLLILTDEQLAAMAKEGSETAEEQAANTLARVKRAMKINYFEDAALIAEQAEFYKTK